MRLNLDLYLDKHELGCVHDYYVPYQDCCSGLLKLDWLNQLFLNPDQAFSPENETKISQKYKSLSCHTFDSQRTLDVISEWRVGVQKITLEPFSDKGCLRYP